MEVACPNFGLLMKTFKVSFYCRPFEKFHFYKSAVYQDASDSNCTWGLRENNTVEVHLHIFLSENAMAALRLRGPLTALKEVCQCNAATS